MGPWSWLSAAAFASRTAAERVKPGAGESLHSQTGEVSLFPNPRKHPCEKQRAEKQSGDIQSQGRGEGARVDPARLQGPPQALEDVRRRERPGDGLQPPRKNLQWIEDGRDGLDQKGDPPDQRLRGLAEAQNERHREHSPPPPEHA